MPLKFGGIFSDYSTINLLASLSIKEFLKSVRIQQSYGQKYSVLVFFGTKYSLVDLNDTWDFFNKNT